MRGNTVTIEMPMQRGKVGKTIPLYQYDYGQKLIITGIDLPDYYEVHFSNELHGEAVTSIGDSTGVDIPDDVLTTGQPIYLWLFLHETGSDGETEFQGAIPVIKRAGISDVEPTPAQQTVIEQAIAALNAGVTEVEEAVEGIEDTIDAALTEAKESGEFDGVSPTVEMTPITNGYQLSITDASGTSTASIMNGEPGSPGTPGTDGVSPTASVSKSGSVATITISDKTGTTTVQVNDGDTGPTPALSIGTVTTGEPGTDADVTITGTDEAPVLNFTIPQGADGDATVDDTAGAGDTEHVWSADKIVEELGEKTDKVASAVSGNFAGLDSNGNLVDSGHKHGDYLTAHQDISGKADKVANASNGHFASLDSNGNLVDSGHKPSDYITSHQDISGKADKVSSATNGNFAGLDSNGNLVDSGHKHSDYLTEHQDISGKADKVYGATNGNLAGLDSNGNLTDSGSKASDFAQASDVGNVPTGKTVQGQIDTLKEEKADIIHDTASGSIATFQDGADSLPMEVTAEIVPVQDLHGQESPYPAGGGKNLLSPPETPNARVTGDGRIVMSGTATGNVDAYSNTLKDVMLVAGTTYTISLQGSKRFRLRAFIHDKTNNNYINIGQLNASYYATYTPSADVVINGILFRAVSGETFDVDAYYQLEVGSTASAYAPYANICPISGWTGANITGTGKNLAFKRLEANIMSNGKIETSSSYSVHIAQVKANATYVVSGNSDVQGGCVIAFFATEPKTDDYSYNGSRTVVVDTKMFIAPIDGYVALRSNKSDTEVQIEAGSTSSAYEAYKGETYSITFPSTVYGGTVKVNKDGSRKLIANVQLLTITGDMITEYGTGSDVANRVHTILNYLQNGYKAKMFCCNLYPVVTSPAPVGSIGIRFHSTNGYIYIYNDQFTDLTVAQAMLNANPVVCALELATPVEIDLTDSDAIVSLLGVNNVWADCGPVYVEYPADTKLYIDKKLSASRNLMELIITANHEDSMKATKAYTAGNLLIVNGTLYKATTSIANGATLTVGTNVTATTVANELALLA